MRKQKQKQTRVYDLPKQSPMRKNKRMQVKQNDEARELQAEVGRVREEMVRGFEAAKSGRLLSDWGVSHSHINDELLAALSTMRTRSREKAKNSPYVKNYFQLLETNGVGPSGFTFKSRAFTQQGINQTPLVAINDVVESHWRKFCAKGVCEVSGKHSMQSLLCLLLSSVARDGDALVRIHAVAKTKKNPYGIAVQVMSIDRLDTGRNGKEGANRVALGVELDEFNKPVAYHMTPYTSSHLDTNAKAERIPADEIIHLFKAEYPEQVRGVPWLHSVMVPLHNLHAFEAYTLISARVGAANMGFLTRTADATGGVETMADGVDEFGDFYIDAEPGMFQALPAGMDVKVFNPAYPTSAYSDFTKSNKRSIANGLGMPFYLLFSDLVDVNYSSSRQEKQSCNDMFYTLHAWLISSFMNPIYEAWLKAAFKNSALTDYTGKAIPDSLIDNLLTNYTFKGRSFPQVDPKGDLDALILGKKNGVYSAQRISEMMGEDYFETVQQLAAERDEAVRLDVFVEDVNDPMANAEMADKKEAREVQAQAMAQAYENASKQATEADTQAKTQDEERKAQFEALSRQFEAVQATLREVLERSGSEKPVKLMTDEELGAALAVMAPVVEPVEPDHAPEQTVEELGKVLAELTADMVEAPAAEPVAEAAPEPTPETPHEPTEEHEAIEPTPATTEDLEQAVQELEAVVAEFEADMPAKQEQEGSNDEQQ